MSADVHVLYQETILQHHRQPRNFRVLEAARHAEGYNRLCGDRVTVYVRVEHGVIADASFQGAGCAISIASASLMTESVKGKTVAEVMTLFDRLRTMLSTPPGGPVDDVGALAALAGLREFPIRVKCATLAWEALRDAVYRTPAASR